MSKYIMHLDVNNAFLSWTAVYLLNNGYSEDIRLIPAIIGGDESKRHGIVLAKSNIAKQFGIETGETIYQAKKKCIQLKVFSSKHDLYIKYSNSLFNILLKYTNKIERFSIDECFIDFSDVVKSKTDFLKLAQEISNYIKQELLFTVNIGLSNNKILAKMASDFEKPDKIHTLYKDEIREKMWNLPIGDLFMVGKKSEIKLKTMGIIKIKDLALYNKGLIIKKFGKFGETIWNYANGTNNDEVIYENELPKSIGKSITLSNDCDDIEKLNTVLLSLSEKVAYKLRKYNLFCYIINVQIKTNEFITYSHQKKLLKPTSSTQEIYNISKELLNKLYTNQKIRLIGVKLDSLENTGYKQLSFFDNIGNSRSSQLDITIDKIKNKYGFASITFGRITNIENENI